MLDLERIAKALESIADSLNKLANPPVMAEPLSVDWTYQSLPGGIYWVPNPNHSPLKDEPNA